MGTNELRHIITEKLSHIEDVSFLSVIKTIIKSKVFEGTYKLSYYQKNRVDMARKQLKNMETISHDELQKEIDQWLSSK
jgi:hypothetical protein